MNNKIFNIIACCILISLAGTAQVTITSGNMPKPGDTVRYSITFESGGIDYQQTGPDVTWDFSDLSVMQQQVDSFASVSETPLTYQLIFNNPFLYPEYQSTVAQEIFEFDLVPGFEVTDVYFFYKESEEDYREVGFGAGLNGVNIPVNYDDIDIIYRFPMNYGDADSSESSFLKSVPGLGTASSEKNRKNYVDGYGTLITPYGTFQTLKVRTEIYQKDSLYIDSTGMGFPLEREYTEYKWLAPPYHFPVLNVREEGLVVTITYMDSVRSNFLGIPEKKEPEGFTLYPNPATGSAEIIMELDSHKALCITVMNMSGEILHTFYEWQQGAGVFRKTLDLPALHLKPGMYLIIVDDGKNISSGKLICQ